MTLSRVDAVRCCRYSVLRQRNAEPDSVQRDVGALPARIPRHPASCPHCSPLPTPRQSSNSRPVVRPSPQLAADSRPPLRRQHRPLADCQQEGQIGRVHQRVDDAAKQPDEVARIQTPDDDSHSLPYAVGRWTSYAATLEIQPYTG